MGTNYYLVNPAANKVIHVGKSSAGWCFALHLWQEDRSYFPLNIETLSLMFGNYQESEGWHIEDEYGARVSTEDMIEVITARSWPIRQDPSDAYTSWAHFFTLNEAVRGPNGLVRCARGPRCLRHARGTWDLMVGEFS